MKISEIVKHDWLKDVEVPKMKHMNQYNISKLIKTREHEKVCDLMLQNMKELINCTNGETITKGEITAQLTKDAYRKGCNFD
jgi:hypothetical protein